MYMYRGYTAVVCRVYGVHMYMAAGT
eukprot:SAG31_NODE_35248_length_325_cov_0.557522_1_plen_25_part_10